MYKQFFDLNLNLKDNFEQIRMNIIKIIKMILLCIYIQISCSLLKENMFQNTNHIFSNIWLTSLRQEKCSALTNKRQIKHYSLINK